MTDLPEHDEHWQARGLCRQVDLGDKWFPDKGGSTREAKAVCRACPVTAACLQYALDHDERFGVWGGASERERRDMQHGRRIPQQRPGELHGTEAAYRQHRREGSTACRACTDAHTLQQRLYHEAAQRRRALGGAA